MTPPSNKQTRKAAETSARERAAALKAQAAAEERRHKLMVRGGIAAVVVAVVAGLAIIAIDGKKSSSSSGPLPTSVTNVKPTGSSTALPPFAAPADTASSVANAGLTVLPNEMLDRHDHVHLDIYADGKPVSVPAYIGIVGGEKPSGLSSLHTHDASGVIHMESPAGDRFSLGQVFNEWNVMLSPTQIGGLKAGNGKTLTFYVDGKKLTTNPFDLELKKHQEIVAVYGTPAENAKVTVPATYKWTNGL